MILIVVNVETVKGKRPQGEGDVLPLRGRLQVGTCWLLRVGADRAGTKA